MAAGLIGAKRAARMEISKQLASLKADSIAKQSKDAIKKVLELPEFQKAQSVFLFLSMKDEMQTSELLQHCIDGGKEVYVPKIVGKRDMAVLWAEKGDVASFEKNKWGIPEPPLPDTWKPGMEWTELKGEAQWALATGPDSHPPPIDLIIVPGMLFDREGHRLGHGRGYYDTFLKRLHEYSKTRHHPFPTLVAPILSCQLSESSVPVDDHDWKMDIIITPDETIDLRH